MEGGLLSVIGILSLVVGFQYKQKLKTTKEINYITQKLEEIVEQDSGERIKVFTSNNEIRNVITAINKLLDYNEENKMQYKKTRYSMQKMLSNISHDLKTPLTVILGYAEMVKLTGKEKDKVDKIYSKAVEVLELINKFFDLAKLESGDKTFPISKVNISEICRQSLLDFYEQLSNDKIKIMIAIPEKDMYALGNEEAISRILNNLIANAVKYGKDGKYLGIRVSEEQHFIKVEVIDKGKGIEEKYKEEVFERIFTLEDSRSKYYQGSGLGLTITKHLVEALGGNIYLESIPNERTVFSFVLQKFVY